MDSMIITEAVDWEQIDTVLLDMDGTLLDLHFDNFFWQHYLPIAYAAQWNLEKNEVEKQLSLRFQQVRGTLDWYCLDYWQRELGMDMVALKWEIRHLIAVRPGVREFLSFLRARGKQLILVTNAHHKSLSLKMDVTGLTPWLDHLLSTHEIGYPKEDQVLWRILFERGGWEPARTLFVDDTARILDAAGQFGIRYLWAIHKPDSQGEPQPFSHYPQICSFHPLVLGTR